MRILGIDPGTLFTGVGVIDADGNRFKLVHYEVAVTEMLDGSVVRDERNDDQPYQ